MKRPPPPPPAEGEEKPEEPELTEEEKAKLEKEKKKKEAEDAKKAKEEEEARKAKDERRRKREEARAAGQHVEESEVEEEKVDDLSIDNLVLRVGADGKSPKIGGFILIGFPQTELHSQKMKDAGIEFDRILNLVDQSEEDAGKAVTQRMRLTDMHYNWELEVEKANKMFTVAKEGAGEDRGDIGAEIAATGSIDDVCIRIRMNIDPFYLRVDNPEENRANADL